MAKSSVPGGKTITINTAEVKLGVRKCLNGNDSSGVSVGNVSMKFNSRIINSNISNDHSSFGGSHDSTMVKVLFYFLIHNLIKLTF